MTKIEPEKKRMNKKEEQAQNLQHKPLHVTQWGQIGMDIKMAAKM
jgi:hypothetical protein